MRRLKIRDTSSDGAPIVGRVIDARRGVLYPARMPAFHRLPPPDAAEHLVSWFWIPQWDIEKGSTSRQHVVAYPALNLVVEHTGTSRAPIQLFGATTAATHRDLEGTGWAVGALLRPAAAAALVADAAEIRDGAVEVAAPDLLDGVTRAMRAGGEGGRSAAVLEFARWLSSRVGEVTPTDALANEMSELLMTDAAVTRGEDAADHLNISLRTLQRLAHRYVGLPPAAMIRRRRLQEAAQRLRDDPDTDLASVAAELGYADHAHLSNEFRRVLGFTPRSYRSDVRS